MKSIFLLSILSFGISAHTGSFTCKNPIGPVSGSRYLLNIESDSKINLKVDDKKVVEFNAFKKSANFNDKNTNDEIIRSYYFIKKSEISGNPESDKYSGVIVLTTLPNDLTISHFTTTFAGLSPNKSIDSIIEKLEDPKSKMHKEVFQDNLSCKKN